MSKILVVDDDLVVLATVSMGLRQAGYQVLQGDNGLLALQICQQDKPDLAILDMRMPGMSGIEVAAHLRKETTVPFIFLTAFSDAGIVREAATLGALGYMVKPIEISCLIPSVEIALIRAEELERLEQDKANLADALDRNREIDIAIGLIMQRDNLDRSAAFESLRAYSRRHGCKINGTAKRLVDGEHIHLGN